MKVKKVNPEWKPSENPNLQVGQTVEITDYTYLVKTQQAVLVDDNGNEIPLPGEAYKCGVCFKDISGTLVDYTTHVLEAHSPKLPAQPKVAPVTPVVTPVAPVEEVTSKPVASAPVSAPVATPEVDVAAKRAEILAKARAAKVLEANK